MGAAAIPAGPRAGTALRFLGSAKVVCPEGKEELVFETIGTKAEPDNAEV